MATRKSFQQLVRYTTWKICKQSFIFILFVYFLPLLFITFSDITEENIQSFSIFFNTFSGIYLSLIIITIMTINIRKLLKTIKLEMDAVYEQSAWFETTTSIDDTSELTLTEFIETKRHIKKMQKKIRHLLEDERKQKQDLMFQVSAAAHDLKTPLTIIKGNAEFLQETDDVSLETQNQCLIDIEHASIKLENYFEQLINFSKTFYHQDSEWQNVSIAELVDLLEQEINYATRKKAIFHLDSNVHEPLEVRINLNMFIRAILNLVTNALHYSTDDKPILNLILNSKEDKLLISFWNSGSQFSQEIYHHVGQLFYQGDSSRNQQSSHYGIGLAFTKRVARLHGGDIKLSNQSNGANVDFSLII